MNDEEFCDRLLDALEAVGKRIRNPDGEELDFYRTWKLLDKTVKALRPFLIGKQNRATARKALRHAPRLNPVQQANMIGIVRKLPELLRYSTAGIGEPETSGRISVFSHDEKKAIREQIHKLAESSDPNSEIRATDAVNALAEKKGIHASKVWEILDEDETLPEYWEREVRRNILLGRNGTKVEWKSGAGQ